VTYAVDRALSGDEYERAAAHEAAHVLANAEFGMESGSVYLISSDSGRVVPNPRWGSLPSEEEQIVCFAAGTEAEVAFGYPDPGRYSSHDAKGERTFARKVLRANWMGGSADWLDSAAVAALVARAHERAAALVEDKRDVITAFATTLLTNGGRLGGDEVSDALRHAVHNWPTPFFSAEVNYQRMVRRRDIFESLVTPSMTAEELATAWRAADEAARSGQLPASSKLRSQVVSGTDWYRELSARQEAQRQRARLLLASPEMLRRLRAAIFFGSGAGFVELASR
jgi:hypothetical protein